MLASKPEVNKRGPEVLLGRGEWHLESNTDLFLVRLKGLSSPDEDGLIIGSSVLLIEEYTIAQVELTGVIKEKVSIFARLKRNGSNPSEHQS